MILEWFWTEWYNHAIYPIFSILTFYLFIPWCNFRFQQISLYWFLFNETFFWIVTFVSLPKCWKFFVSSLKCSMLFKLGKNSSSCNWKVFKDWQMVDFESYLPFEKEFDSRFVQGNFEWWILNNLTVILIIVL